MDIETYLRAQGYTLIAGIDEAGRGPLAGPVVAAAVILPEDFDVRAMQDSKMLSLRQRETAYEMIMAGATVGIGIEDSRTVDQLNIRRATHRAMRKAAEQLHPVPDYLLIDGPTVGDIGFPYTAAVKGDRHYACIAAASIVAKVTRDSIMVALDTEYPGYGFARHKGYPTPEHFTKLAEKGPCPIHRRSFAPVAAAIARQCGCEIVEDQLSLTGVTG